MHHAYFHGLQFSPLLRYDLSLLHTRSRPSLPAWKGSLASRMPLPLTLLIPFPRAAALLYSPFAHTQLTEPASLKSFVFQKGVRGADSGSDAVRGARGRQHGGFQRFLPNFNKRNEQMQTSVQQLCGRGRQQ